MRKRRQKETFDAPDLLDLSRRAVRLDNDAIHRALDTTLANANRYYSDYRQTYNNDFLGELSLAAQAIYTMANELATRSGDIPSTKPARQLGRF